MMFYVLVVLIVAAVGWVLMTRNGLLKACLAEAEPPASRFPRVEALVEQALFASFGLLVLSGLFLAGGVTGVFVVLHMFAGAIFSACLAAIVVLRAEANSDMRCCCEGANLSTFLERLCFWALAAIGLCMIVSAVLLMTPLLGSPGQIFVTAIHKYMSIVVLIPGIGYGYFAAMRCCLNKQAQG